jgi:hypothetical protein
MTNELRGHLGDEDILEAKGEKVAREGMVNGSMRLRGCVG